MEGDIPSTQTQNYDQSGHINNDPPHDDNEAGEGDLESEQGSEDPVGPKMEEIGRKSLLRIEEIYGQSTPVNGTMESEVITNSLNSWDKLCLRK